MLTVKDKISRDFLFIKIIFYFFKFFGIATMTYDVPSNTNTKQDKQMFIRSKKGFLYNAFLMCLTIGTIYHSFNLAYISDLTIRNLTEKLIDTWQTMLCLFTTMFILVMFCVQQEKVITISNELTALTKLSRNFDKRTCTKRESILLNEVKIILFANLLTTIACVVTIPTDYYDVMMFFVSVTLYSLVINAMLIQYTVVLKVICHMFKTINASLLCTLEESTVESDITFIKNYTQRMKLNQVSQLRDFYISVGRLSKDVSNFYSPLMLFCCMNIFFTLLIYSYYVVKEIWFQTRGFMMYLAIHNSIQLVFITLSSIILVTCATAAVIEVLSRGTLKFDCST